MSYTALATQYRETQVLTASPAQLVVILYDHILVNLRRASLALDVAKVEVRLNLLDRARAALGELLATLDRDRGGQIANELAALYAYLLNELLDIGRAPDAARLERVTAMVTELRDAFAYVAGERLDAQ